MGEYWICEQWNLTIFSMITISEVDMEVLVCIFFTLKVIPAKYPVTFHNWKHVSLNDVSFF